MRITMFEKVNEFLIQNNFYSVEMDNEREENDEIDLTVCLFD